MDNFSDYPKKQLDMLYECYKEAAFDYKTLSWKCGRCLMIISNAVTLIGCGILERTILKNIPIMGRSLQAPPRRRNSSYLERNGKKMEYTGMECDY